MEMKICPRCKEEKNITDYHKDQSKSRGISSHCKTCSNKARKKRDTPEYRKEKYLRNRATVLEKAKEDRLNNPQKYRDAVKRWRDSNPEVVKKRQKEYYQKNAEKEKNRSNKWISDNPERARESRRKYRAKNSDKLREAHRLRIQEQRPKRKMFSIEYKGGKCEDCGLVASMENRSIFDFHHTDPSVKNGDINDIYRKGLEKLKTELDKCVLLCSNCHRLRHQHFKDGLRETL